MEVVLVNNVLVLMKGWPTLKIMFDFRRHSCPHNPDDYNDHLHPEGPIYAQPKDEYNATKGDRFPIKKPQDHLHPEGT